MRFPRPPEQGRSAGQTSRPRRSSLGFALAVVALAVVPAVALGVAGDFTQPASSPETAGAAPLSLSAGDLNGDANADLAITDFADSEVSILLGDGTGNFTEASTSPEAVGATSSSVAIANLGGDASPDLAVANLGTDDVTVLIGDGTGDFTEAGTSPEAVGLAPISVAAANLGGSASMDLAVANNDDDDVTVLLGDGTGSFTEPVSSPETVGTGPRMIVAANLGGSASMDLATANRESGNVSILLGDGTGNFTAAGTSPEDVELGPSGLAAANLNGDANLDLAVANRDSGNVSILLGNGAGDFTAAGPPETVGNAPRWLAAADLAGDDSTDLAVANAGSDDISVLVGDGSGGFTPASTSPESGSGGQIIDEPFSIVAANFGGSADLDLATANPEGGNVSVLLNGSDDADTDPPETTITKKPKKKLTKTKAKVKFSSDEAGSTFECRLKGKKAKKKFKRFRDCSSPAKYKKLKPGKLKFAVRATDAAGNVDGTPAKAKFKVVSK